MKLVRFLLILFALNFALPISAQNFPALTGRVVDNADLLTPVEEEAVTAKLKSLEEQSGRQLVVVTLPDLQGVPISDYGYQLGRAWGIGAKGKDNGVILLIAKAERRMRIEVGYGLEPILTDLYSGRVIREQMTPRFKAGDYPGGINAGVDAISSQILLPPGEAAKRAQQYGNGGRRNANEGVNISTILFWFFIFFFVIMPIMRAMFGRRGQSYGSSPVIIWGPGNWSGGGGSSSWGGGSSWGDGGGFSGGGGSFGGGGASGSW
jgi:uncharacterized protein